VTDWPSRLQHPTQEPTSALLPRTQGRHPQPESSSAAHHRRQLKMNWSSPAECGLRRRWFSSTKAAPASRPARYLNEIEERIGKEGAVCAMIEVNTSGSHEKDEEKQKHFVKDPVMIRPDELSLICRRGGGAPSASNGSAGFRTSRQPRPRSDPPGQGKPPAVITSMSKVPIRLCRRGAVSTATA